MRYWFGADRDGQAEVVDGPAPACLEGMRMDISALLESVPTPSAEDMDRRRRSALRYTLVLLRPGPASRDNPDYDRIHREHLQHLTKLQILGKLVLNGPTASESDVSGISVYATELDEARLLAEADPKVRSGHLIVEAIAWIAVPGDIDGLHA
jgi:uncharacterized protein YciI